MIINDWYEHVVLLIKQPVWLIQHWYVHDRHSQFICQVKQQRCFHSLMVYHSNTEGVSTDTRCSKNSYCSFFLRGLFTLQQFKRHLKSNMTLFLEVELLGNFTELNNSHSRIVIFRKPVVAQWFIKLSRLWQYICCWLLLIHCFTHLPFCHISILNVNGSWVAVDWSMLCHVSSSMQWLIILWAVWMHVPEQVLMVSC